MKIPKRKTIKRRYWFSLWMFSILIVAGIAFERIISAPSHGRITTSSSRFKPSSSKPTAAPASDIQTEYFKLALPAGYKQQAGSHAVPGLLYQQTIIKSSMSGSLVISIAISSLGSGLNENTSYRLRIQDTARYKLATQAVQGDKVTITNDSQSASLVAFWPHGDKLATIGVSSGLQNPAVDNNVDEIKALQPLLAAWQWQ